MIIYLCCIRNGIEKREFQEMQRRFGLEKECFKVQVKEFEEKKYAFLMENSLVPEWKEKEAENLLIFYSVVQAYLNLNILYYETLVKLKTLEKIAKKIKANVYCLRKMSRS